MASSPRSFTECVRRNHALEHATLHVLAREMPNLSLVGRSDWRGFTLYGDVPTEALQPAVKEAFERLQAGEVNLAVHPRCGTNLAVATVLTSVAVLIGALLSQGSRRRRWPLTALSVAGALMLATPLGPEVQRHMTTDPDMAGVTIGAIKCQRNGRWTVHQVEIQHES